MRKKLPLLLLPLLCSCAAPHLSVIREGVSRESLASTFVESPDFRQADPPKGERLLLGWRLSKRALYEGATLRLNALYQDLSEEEFSYPIDKKAGWHSFCLLGAPYEEKGGLLAYKVTLLKADGAPLKEWTHQLFRELIVVE